MNGITSYDEMKKLFDQLQGVSNYEEAVAFDTAAQNFFNPKSNKNDPWIPAGSENYNNVTVTVPPPEVTRPPGLLDFIFPFNLITAYDILTTGQLPTMPLPGAPDITITGSPEDVAATTNLIAPTEENIKSQTPTDPLAGLGSTVDLIVKFLPILLVVGLVTSIKKVF